MARFIVIHTPVSEATQEEVVASARGVVASLPPGMEWLNSWAATGPWQLFCEWEAPNADAIRDVLKAYQHLLPIDAIHEVEWINPEWYK